MTGIGCTSGYSNLLASSGQATALLITQNQAESSSIMLVGRGSVNVCMYWYACGRRYSWTDSKRDLNNEVYVDGLAVAHCRQELPSFDVLYCRILHPCRAPDHSHRIYFPILLDRS